MILGEILRVLDPRARRTIAAHALAVLCLVSSIRAPAAAVESVENVRRLIEAGAVELALARIDALQPAQSNAPQWADWEGLRCATLARLERNDELLIRVAGLPVDMTAPALRNCFVAGAAAAVSLQDARAARDYAARLLWRMSPSAEEIRAARLSVIESYVLERRGDDAFRSMLRFQQDYQPLDRAIARRFAEALVDLGLEREALTWAGDGASPIRLRLQLRAGVLTAESAVAQARAALARTPDVAYANVILDAASRQRNVAWEAEALERLLQLSAARDGRRTADVSRRLWQVYISAAGEVGNRERLLVGDDNAWSEYAARRLGSEPVLARALYGYLAQNGTSAEGRRNAQLQLAAALRSAGLEQTALRLFANGGPSIDTLDPQTRYLLGSIAVARNEPELVVRFWSGLAPPPQVNAAEWRTSFARAALRAGDVETALAALQHAMEAKPASTVVQQTLELAQELIDLRQLDSARRIYELVFPVTTEARTREVLLGLGRIHDLQGQPVLAADYYLRSAVLVDARSTDVLALQARLLAAASLMRAGYRGDARAQFEWVAKSSKDPATAELARRELKKP